MTHFAPVPDVAVANVPPIATPRPSATLEQAQPPAYTVFGPVTFTFAETNGILGQRRQLMTLSDILVEQWASNIEETQRWFWTSGWQAGEREASEDIARGNVTRFGNDNDFLGSL